MSSAILNTGYTHKIKLYNIVTPAIDEVKRLRLRKVAILATKFTIASKEYEKRLKAIGIDELLSRTLMITGTSSKKNFLIIRGLLMKAATKT